MYVEFKLIVVSCCNEWKGCHMWLVSPAGDVVGSVGKFFTLVCFGWSRQFTVHKPRVPVGADACVGGYNGRS